MIQMTVTKFTVRQMYFERLWTLIDWVCFRWMEAYEQVVIRTLVNPMIKVSGPRVLTFYIEKDSHTDAI